MVVDVQDVSKRFGARWALARLSLRVPKGRAVLLTGPNGAGKTTLLKLLATVDRPTFGTIRLFNQPAADPLAPIRRRIGLVTHQSLLYDRLSARENLQLAARLRRMPRDPEGIQATLERLGLDSYGSAPLGTLSAGLVRRVALARLLYLQPELALLDEPFGQLDPQGVQIAEQAVRGLLDRGTTVVLSTHDIARGRALCHLHLALANGRAVGPLSPIQGSP